MDVYAGASPEGPEERNIELGQRRAESIAAVVRERLGDRIGNIVLHNLGPRWDDLYNMVEASDEPWRYKVLAIISSDERGDPKYMDPRERRLRNLDGGKVWPVLLDKYLAPLRSGGGAAGTAVVSWHPELVERDTVVIQQVVVQEAAPRVRDTVVIREVTRDTVVVVHEHYYYPDKQAPRERRPADQTKAWAVKTNLLLLGVVAPNLEVELPLGNSNRWSLEVEAFTPWFVWNRNAQASQCVNLGVEGRLWLGDRQYHRWLDGWHIGLAVAGAYYDWEWKKSEGWQGEYLNTYINIGWQHRFGEHWALDLGLGLGALGTQYRHYYGSSVFPEGREEEWDKHLIWHDTGRYVWPGPCHANFSLVYMFNYKPRKDRR